MNKDHFVVWFTGLSGSGKSTIANYIYKKLIHLKIKTTILDGDKLRSGLNSDLGFSTKDRNENLRRAAELAKLLCEKNKVVLCSFISPLKSQRELIKKILYKNKFILVFVDTPLETCIKRDSKGLYKKAIKGEIKEFSGISQKYEPPLFPNVLIKNNDEIENNINKIIKIILS